MSAKSLRTAVPQNLLSYLENFENDRNKYITDPKDERRIIVANQQIFKFLGKGSVKVGDTIRLVLHNEKKRNEEEFITSSTEITVVGKSIWRPDLVLLQGSNLHSFVKDQKWEDFTGDFLVEVIGSNAVTTTSGGIQAHDPTRTSDGGIQAHDPTRTSDGVTRNIENLSEGSYTHWAVDHCVPLTEFWLGKAKKHNRTHKNSPIVAILDTGIDFRYDWTMSAFPEPNCPLWFNEEESYQPLQKDLIGWNFVGTGSLLYSSQHNNPFDDDSIHKHGTRIAAILAQQCLTYQRKNRNDCEIGQDVRLMILKTHDYRGVGLLFDIFCAFDYVLSHPEVKVINASWGFYGTPIDEFGTYMCRFQEKDVWVVAAAGNSNDFNDDFRIHELSRNSATEFYPACYSREYKNVLTVTTALSTTRIDSNDESELFQIQPCENYSRRYVDVAVTAGKDGSFPESLRKVNHVIKGTSYATAYAIGKLIRSGHVFKSKSDFLDASNLFISQSVDLSKYVKDGCFITSDTDEEKERI